MSRRMSRELVPLSIGYRSPRNARARANVAVTLFNGLGDGLLARPTLRILAKQYARVDLYCLAGEERAVFGGLGIHVYPRTKAELSPPQGRKPFLWISLNAYSPVSMELPFVSAWSNVPRLGFVDPARSPSARWQRLPMRNQYLRVAGVSGRCQVRDAPPFISREAERQAHRWLGEETRMLCVLHADTLQEKMWPVDRWHELLALLEGRFRLVACGESSQFWESIPSVRTAWPTLGFSAQLALVRVANFFIGVDSVFMHAADAFERAGLVLFGPGDPPVWGPGSTRLRVVSGRGAMDSLTVSDATTALRESLPRTQKSHRLTRRIASPVFP